MFFVFGVLCAFVVGVGVEYGDCCEPEYAYPVLCCHVFIVPYFVWVFNAKYPLGGGHGFSPKNQPICCFMFKKLLLHTFLLMCASGKIVVSFVLRLVLSVSACVVVRTLSFRVCSGRWAQLVQLF